ncbi:unnamed protein product [Brachionus calyciflorus]|uniref:Uncharacterized protein n=1 Tax=Brachionus calyciflorus TaxID=104777 RepID=A0A813M453_9BILA|nr:unnamed protein product [Brachionus calyciflorus]
MYIGQNRHKIGYTVPTEDGVVALKETFEEKDLGVVVSNDLKWSKQCSSAASKANRVLGQIRNAFVDLDKETFRLLYTGLVRPHLEYAVSIWNRPTKANINIIERVQRRATKLVKCLNEKPYQERLLALGLMSLEERRKRGDLIQMFKIINRHEKINKVKGLNLATSLKLNLRRQHDIKLERELCKKATSKYNFLTNRVVSMWNDLPQSVVNSKTVNGFKAGIDKEVFGMERRKK